MIVLIHTQLFTKTITIRSPYKLIIGYNKTYLIFLGFLFKRNNVFTNNYQHLNDDYDISPNYKLNKFVEI